MGGGGNLFLPLLFFLFFFFFFFLHSSSYFLFFLLKFMTALRKFNDQESDSWRGNVLSLCGTRFGTECQECVYVGWGGGGGGI